RPPRGWSCVLLENDGGRPEGRPPKSVNVAVQRYARTVTCVALWAFSPLESCDETVVRAEMCPAAASAAAPLAETFTVTCFLPDLRHVKDALPSERPAPVSFTEP